jgi:hypothetical protein
MLAGPDRDLLFLALSFSSSPSQPLHLRPYTMPGYNTLGYYDPYDFSDNSDSDEEDHMDQDVNMDIQSNDGVESQRSFRTRSSQPNSSVHSAGPSFKAMTEASHPSSYTSYERTNQDSQSRSPSPASVISLTDSLQTHIYRQEFGRGLNNYCDVYRLPADDEEWLRLGVCPSSSEPDSSNPFTNCVHLMQRNSTRCSSKSWAPSTHQT